MSGNVEDEEGEEVIIPNPLISNVEHPLLNPVVASRLFELVNLSQLRTLRLVCKGWHSISLPLWRRTVQINIHEESSNDQLLQWKSLGNQLDISRETPFRNFRLHTPQFLTDISRPYDRIYGNNYPRNFEATYRNMEQFWVNYGHWIHKLELKEVHVTDVAAFKRAIFEQTPNLEELILDELRDWSVKELANPIPRANGEDGSAEPLNLNLRTFALKGYTKLPFGWRLLFNRFPNIQKLELSEPESVDEFVDCVENMLRNPARRPHLLITDLRLKGFHVKKVSDAVKGLLRLPLMRLKVLHLCLSNSLGCDYGFHTALQLHGNTLKELHLENGVIHTALQLHGDTLKELHLENGVMSTDFWESQVGPYVSLTELQMKGRALAFSFNFLHKLPNLKILRLEQQHADEMLDGTDWSSLERMPNLREFSFIVTRSVVYISEETLDRFAELMPNLESFTGQLTNMTLRVICRNWRKLQKLVILSGWDLKGVDPTDPPLGDIMDIDDVGITGIVSGSDERVPCVADLQELRHLTLEHVTLIGEASVFYGFLKLPHLSSLDICDTNQIWEGLEALENRLKGGLTFTPLCG